MLLNIFQERKESFQPSRVPMQWHMQRKLAPTMKKDQIIVINISGRGDKGLRSNRPLQRGGYP